MTRRGARGWALALAAVLVVPALVVAPVLAVVVAALGLQYVLAAGRWPALGRAGRTLLVRTGPTLVGGLAVLLVLDYGVGLLWNEARGEDTSVPESRNLADDDLPPTTDPRVTVPAFAGEDWAERYFEEMDALEYHYVPFLGPRVDAVEGRYITSERGVRRSYEPPGAAGDDAVEVWFFGGSTTWGEGQRDLHTIPSEVARLAEADGVTLRVVNFGERGYTAFQELLLFEQELAARPAPDLAVFYDGQNELGTQQQTYENLSPQPTVYQLDTVLEALRRAPALPDAPAPDDPTLGAEYLETSALHKLLRRLHLVDPAAAQPLQPLEEVVANAADIYGRSVELIDELSARTGTPVVNFWQPGKPPRTISDEVLRRARRPDVVDISDAFDGVADDQLYIDGGHTNERGAHLAATAIWEHLADLLPEPGS
jgi:lysophospholipase L1-like esterase